MFRIPISLFLLLRKVYYTGHNMFYTENKLKFLVSSNTFIKQNVDEYFVFM